MSSDNRPMTAVVEFQIRPENTTMEEWLDEWQKRAEDALECEPETTAYEACINEEDPTRHGHPWRFNITPILGRYARTELVCPIPLLSAGEFAGSKRSRLQLT